MTDPKKSKVLVADDDEISAAYLGIVLKKMGFIPIHAVNGLDVLRLLNFERPDVALLDIGMEPINGIVVLRHIKRDENLFSIPVIMMSGEDSNETIEKCRKSGSAGYLKKPVTIAELHKALEACLFARRKHCRVSVNKEVIVIYNEKPYSLITETLSEGGVYVKKNDPFPLGAEVEVTLPFLDKGSFSLQGTVMYAKNPLEKDTDGLSGMGIQFRGQSHDASKILKEYIETNIAEGTRIV
jgi:CheY-like chemotaxis protein/Tfp pilus assembly protein PilZ